MKASIVRSDTIYEAAFSRPAFEQIASFTQIIEPICDAFCSEVIIPSEAINLGNGNSLATSGVTLTLFSGRSVFEARLDGYRACSYDLRSPEDIERAKRHAKLFESAIRGFLTDSVPAHSRFITPSWLAIEGGKTSTEALIRNLTWLPKADDPFQIGATEVHSIVKFECINKDELWNIGITVDRDRSALPEADLFLELSGEYALGSQLDTFDKIADHFFTISQSIVDKLDLIIE